MSTPEPAPQPQSDIPSDTQPMITEPVLTQAPPPPPPARWRVSKGALLLIGGPLAGALLVWLGLSIFSSKPSAPADAEQSAQAAASETSPSVVETPPSTEMPPSAEALPSTETPPSAEAQPAMDETLAESAGVEPAPVDPEPLPAADPEPRQPPEASPSAIGEASVVNEVMPKVPQSALDTIRGTVRVSVRVAIDNEGAVGDAVAEDPGPSRYFERLSVNAAKKWTFTAADSAEERTVLVRFAFTREGVTAQVIPNLTPQP